LFSPLGYALRMMKMTMLLLTTRVGFGSYILAMGSLFVNYWIVFFQNVGTIIHEILLALWDLIVMTASITWMWTVWFVMTPIHIANYALYFVNNQAQVFVRCMRYLERSDFVTNSPDYCQANIVYASGWFFPMIYPNWILINAFLWIFIGTGVSEISTAPW
jgi:hypothetical protein